MHTSRKSALAAGATHYCTGKPCKRGHVGLRIAKFGDCLECKRGQLAEWRAKNSVCSYAITKAWRMRNRAEYLQSKIDYYGANTDAHRERGRLHRARFRTELLAYAAAWRKANPGKTCAYANERRCSKIQRTPIWADIQAIQQFYVDCPAGHQVDHVIPLRGKLVSGLHVLENLQYLTTRENLIKSNRFTPYMELNK